MAYAKAKILNFPNPMQQFIYQTFNRQKVEHFLLSQRLSSSITALTVWAIGVLLFLTSAQLHSQVDAGIDFDLQGFIDAELAKGKKNIVIPPGRYRVIPNSRQHLRLVNLKDVTIDATGVEMICTETTRALTIYKSENLKLIGLTIDYDPLPFSQGVITAISADEKTIEVELFDGYPGADLLENHKLEVYSQESNELITHTIYGIEIGVINSRKITVHSMNGTFESIVGAIAVLGADYGNTIPHAIAADQSKNLVLSKVTLYASNSFGFYETNCTNSRYENCTVDRRPLATDIKQRGYPRLRSLNADAYHSKYAAIGPAYSECLARYMGDDGIAINGNYHLVGASEGGLLRVFAKLGNHPVDLAIDDTVELVSYTGERLEDAKITAIVEAPPPTEAELDFLGKQSFVQNTLDKTLNTNMAYLITLDRDVHLPVGSLIAAADRLGNGFTVENCEIGPNRSRGILVKASDGNIVGNRLVDNWGEAIKVAPEYKWLEAGSSNNVVIDRNTITGCRNTAIAVYAKGGNGAIAPVGAHNNIQITTNQISGSTNPGIAVTSIKGLLLFDNVIEHPDNDLLARWYRTQFGHLDDPNRQIYLENVTDKLDDTDLLEKWRWRFGLDLTGAKDSEDLSGDGLPAIFSFAFNLGDPNESNMRTLDLNAPENGGLPLLTTQPELALHYIQRIDSASQLIYQSQFSPDLTANAWKPIIEIPGLQNSISSFVIEGTDYELISIVFSGKIPAVGFFRINIESPLSSSR